MRPGLIRVPESLLTDPRLSEGAKVLWCYLNAHQYYYKFTYSELRSALGISQNSLLKYRAELTHRGWLRWTRHGLRAFTFKVILRKKTKGINLPPELLFHPNLPHDAKWLWALISHEQTVSLRALSQRTGYCTDSIIRYLHLLHAANYLTWNVPRSPADHVSIRPLDPSAIRRESDLEELEREIALTKRRGYSLGQCLMTLMVRLILEDTYIVQNAELSGLKNLPTGGQMHYDLFIPQYDLALEFQGPQHYGPTELFSDVEQYREQCQRDIIKQGLSTKRNIELVEVRPDDLSFTRLSELLAGKAPLRKSLSDVIHLVKALEKKASAYRRRAGLCA